jgi:hypothetical protein
MDDRCERSSVCQSVSIDMIQTKNIISNLTRKSNSKTTVKVGKTKVFGGFVVLVIDTNKSAKT